MYSAYFEKSLPLFSYEDICKVAETVGIQSKDLLAVLESDLFQEAVVKDRKVASELGATGVPFFVVDMKYGISGAQPLEVFLQTLETAWQERS
jgi:predicted DsbA family dithiol-disulfide isomerase